MNKLKSFIICAVLVSISISISLSLSLSTASTARSLETVTNNQHKNHKNQAEKNEEEKKESKQKSQEDAEREPKERVYERVSRGFFVDKETIKDLEKTVAEKDMTLKEAIMIIILARARANILEVNGKNGSFTKERDKEAMEESIKYFWKKLNGGASWNELANEVNIRFNGLARTTRSFYRY